MTDSDSANDTYSDNTLDSDPDEEVEVVVTSVFRILSGIHQELRKNHPVNLVYSPLSLSCSLGFAKLALAAKSHATNEIIKTLGFPQNDLCVSKGFEAIFKSLLWKAENNLVISQEIFIQSGYSIKEEFKKVLKTSLHTDVQFVDFARNNTIKSSMYINSLIEDKTNGKIKDVVFSENIDRKFTRMLLINGIYFNESWDFQIEEITTLPFYLNANTSVEIDMIKCRRSKFTYGILNKLECQVVILPYVGRRFGMAIFIPKHYACLEKLETGIKSLNPSLYMDELRAQRKNLSENTYIEVTLPIFNVASTIHLEQPLKQCGIKTLCQPGCADFSGFSDESQGLFVYDIIQKAVIDMNVNVESTRGASSEDISPTLEIIKATADRPFFFQIIDYTLDLVILCGSFSNPMPLGLLEQTSSMCDAEANSGNNPKRYPHCDNSQSEQDREDYGFDTATGPFITGSVIDKDLEFEFDIEL